MSNVEILLWFFTSILVGFTNNYIFIYLPFVLSSYITLVKYKKTGDIVYLFILALLCFILPDNYIIYLALICIFICLKKKSEHKYINKKKIVMLYLSIIFLILNTLLNEILVINKLFSIFYLIPIFLCIPIIEYKFTTNNYKIIKKYISNIVVIQLVFVLSKFILSFSLIRQTIDFDWVVGTLGTSQGNILLFFCIFSFVYFFNDYMNNKCRNSLKYILLSLFLIIMTGSIALILLFATSSIIIVISSKKIEKKFKQTVLFILCFGAVSFLIITPSWIKIMMVDMFKSNNISKYAYKIEDYKNVYFELPKESPIKYFIGVGIGQYSSRSALTCTGLYIPSYTKIFKNSISQDTSKWIYKRFYDALEYQLSSISTPYSSYISVQGEAGMIGTITLIFFLRYLLKKTKKLYKIFIVFFCFSCLIENYLEFSKIIFLLFFIISISNVELLKE